MRVMMKVTIETEAGNRAIADGTLAAMMEQMLGDLRPEAAYFGSEHGQRTNFIVFDLQDPSQIPPIAEPFFRTLNAKVEIFPVMNREDLQKGLGQLAR